MNKLINWIKGVFSKLQRLLNKYIPIAVDIVQAIKKAIESGTVDTIAKVAISVFPKAGVPLEVVIAFLKKEIPTLCVQLEIIEASQQEDVESALSALKSTYGDKWEEFMKGIAGKLVEFLADGKIDWKEAAELASIYYRTYVKED